MTRELPIIAVTAGDVAGIGPEILLRAVMDKHVRAACRVVILCHPEILQRAALLVASDRQLELALVDRLPDDRSKLLQMLDEADVAGRFLCCNPGRDDVTAAAAGAVDSRSGDAAYRYLIEATTAARTGVVDGISTAPLNKESLHAAGHDFPGHTEILAHECGVADFAMMLYLPESRLAPLRRLVSSHGAPPESLTLRGLSVAHVTLHTSIRSVPELLNADAVADKIRLLDVFLKRTGCQRAAIGVCALNPHGGENGLFGDEEARLIQPAVGACREQSINVHGPLPVDTLFRRAVCGEFDGVVAMYHDQGHIPIKLIGFDSAVNITLGLPIVRTSPTHGTAFDRAWRPESPADAAGMVEAIQMAVRLSHSRS